MWRNTVVWVWIVCCACSCPAGEPRPGWSSIKDLLGNSTVLHELEIGPAQQAKLEETLRALDSQKPTSPELWQAIGKTLSAEQLKRLQQIQLQALNGLALEDPEIAATLHLSPAQKASVQEAAKANAKDEQEMEDVMKRVRFPTEESRKKFIQKYRERASDRLLAILTPSQKELLQEMMGKKLREPIMP
jgi:hypothetical protein